MPSNSPHPSCRLACCLACAIGVGWLALPPASLGQASEDGEQDTGSTSIAATNGQNERWQGFVLAGLEDLEGSLSERAAEVVEAYSTPQRTRLAAEREAEAAARRLRRFLNAEGYFDPAFTLETADDARRLVLSITSGERYTLAGLTVDWVETEPDAVQAVRTALARFLGEPARAQTVREAEKAALTALRQAGFPEAQREDRFVRVDHGANTLSVTFTLRAGPAVVFGPFVMTQDSADVPVVLINRLRPYERGARFRPGALQTLRDRLADIEALRSATVTLAQEPPSGMKAFPQTAAGEDIRPVRIDLDDEPSHTVSAGAAYSTTEGPSGLFRWQRRNAFHQAETIDVRLNAGTIERLAEASIRFPHVLRFDRQVTGRLAFRDEETDAFDRRAGEISAGFSQPLFGPWETSARVLAEISSSETQSFDGVVYSLGLPLELIRDARDAPLEPADGTYAGLRVEPSRVFGNVTTNFVTLSSDLRGYFGVHERLVLAGRMKTSVIVGAEAERLPPESRLFAGGGGSVRGFDFQALSPRDDDGALIGGASRLELSAEARMRLYGNIGGVVFVDAGGAFQPKTPQLSEIEWAAGLGARYRTDFGIFRADIAFPVTTRDRHNTVEFYLSIGQAF